MDDCLTDIVLYSWCEEGSGQTVARSQLHPKGVGQFTPGTLIHLLETWNKTGSCLPLPQLGFYLTCALLHKDVYILKSLVICARQNQSASSPVCSCACPQRKRETVTALPVWQEAEPCWRAHQQDQQNCFSHELFNALNFENLGLHRKETVR